MIIRKCTDRDFDMVLQIINKAAYCYKGVIPADRWHEPYMSGAELNREISDGVEFWGVEDNAKLVAVMGIQDKGEVTLLRHAYVVTDMQRNGVGTRLLGHVEALDKKPILVGTWADASWAISFYEKNGYTLIPPEETGVLLRKYWSIPERQVETSVVLAKDNWGKT